jgi:hypothetical protein
LFPRGEHQATRSLPALVLSCADSAKPNCTNCRYMQAAGGGDRRNNGTNGYDYIYVQAV